MKRKQVKNDNLKNLSCEKMQEIIKKYMEFSGVTDIDRILNYESTEEYDFKCMRNHLEKYKWCNIKDFIRRVEQEGTLYIF